MSTYRIKESHVKNKISFVCSILGCILQEIKRFNNRPGARNEALEVFSEFSRYLTFILNLDISSSEALDNYGSLDFVVRCEAFSKIQEVTDTLISYFKDPIEIEILGEEDGVNQAWILFLPDFGGKVKIKQI